MRSAIVYGVNCTAGVVLRVVSGVYCTACNVRFVLYGLCPHSRIEHKAGGNGLEDIAEGARRGLETANQG